MKHKLLTLLFMAFIPIAMMAYDCEVDGIFYDLSGNTACVTYQYALEDGGAFSPYSGYINIPSSFVYNGTTYTVTSIGGDAFYDCTDLTSINIPEGVTSIEDCAFFGCTGLTTIDIPSGVTRIEYFTFNGCSGLTSVNIPNSVTMIGERAFANCSGLTSISIPNSVTFIGEDTFANCSGLTSITIPTSVTSIWSGAFLGCSGLTSVTVENPTPVSIRSYNTFSNRANATLYVPYGSKSAYEAADGWKEFGNIVEFITFADANVKALCVANWDTNQDGELSMAEAAAVTNLGTVFYGNETITSFDELEYFVGLTYLTNSSFSRCRNLHSINIPENVKYIFNGAFSECESLTKVILPNSLLSISLEAFFLCENLEELNLPNSLTNIGNQAFYLCKKLEELNLPNSLTSIGNEAFVGCEKLTTLSIPGNVETIGAHAFQNCRNIESLIISDGVNSIGFGAFAGLEKIKSINIPQSVTQIDYSGGNPFYYCKSLETITVDENNPNYESKNNSIIEKSTNTLVTASINTSIPGGTKIIGTAAFYGLPIETIQIPSGVTCIGNSAFSNCENLKSIDIPYGVTKIDNFAFSYCPKLESVKLPSTLKEIGEGAFWTNSNYLKSIVIPEGVTTIGNSAFRECYALEFVSLPSSLTGSFYFSPFSECNNLTIVESNMTSPSLTIYENTFPNRANSTLYVPAGCKDAYEEADYWKEFNTIVEFGCIGNVDSELTGETGISCFFVNRPGQLKNLYIQAGKPEKVKIIGEIDANDLSALCNSGYWYEMYYPTYVDLSEAHINASSHYDDKNYPYGYKDYPDNYLDSDWLLCSNSENDDTDWHGPSTIVLPLSLEEYVGRANNIYSEQTTPFKTTIRGSSEGYYDSTCRFYVPSGTRMGWVEKTTYPDNVMFIDGPTKNIYVNTAGTLASFLTDSEIETMNELTIRGRINAKDFSVLKQMRNLVSLYFSSVIWEQYEGNEGPFAGQTSYRACEIPAYVFQNQSNLQKIIISLSGKDGLIIGDYAFDGCTNLNTFSCEGVSSLGDFCFRNTKVKGATLLGVKYYYYDSEDNYEETGTENNREFEHIGLQPFFGVQGSGRSWDYAMMNSDYGGFHYDLDDFTVIPSYWDIDVYGYSGRPFFSGVTNKAETYLYALTTNKYYNLTLPSSITTLADYAISGLQLASINLGSVTSIGDGFLYQCPYLNSIICDNSAFKAVDGVLYSADMKTLVKYPCASNADEYVIPSSVTQISKWAFEGAGNLNTIRIEANTPPSLGEMVFEGFDLTNTTLYVPAGTKAAYEAADVWKEFGTIIEMEEQNISPDDIYLLKNVETGKYLYTGNAWGTHAVLADVGLPAQISKQSDGSYTIFFPVGSGNQQMLFRDNEESVYVDYNVDGCPFWTFTNTGNGNYLIQTLTTHETYGQEAMPGTYLGNDPTKEAHDQGGTALGVYNDVDGNVTDAEDMNITWTLEPVSARSDAQVALLQELITTAQELDMDTGEEETLLNNQEATYLEMTETIIDLQKRIKEREKAISDGNKKKEDLNMLIACANAIGVDTGDAQAVADNSSNLEEVNEAINTLRETYITKLGEGVATTLLPLDVTGVILNPSFVIDDADGWSWNEGEDGPGFECWNDAEYFERTFDIHQQLTGLPNGNYLLKVKGFHRPGMYENVLSDYQQGTDNATAQLYANDESVTLANIAIGALEEQIEDHGVDVSNDGTTWFVPNNMEDANAWFANGYYEHELPVTVTDGTLTVGIRLDESVEAGWVIFDDFRLYYQGENIEFADENVKAICVANWDTNEDGELSMAEAAAVTDLGEVFHENREITSFDELQYFTGLTSIGAEAFRGCSNLTSITIPANVTSIGQFAFNSNTGLRSIVIPENLTIIGYGAFSWCTIESVTIPNSVTVIEEYAFHHCLELTSVTVEWDDPLAVPENVFEDVALENATLYVPEGTKAAYKAADVWKEFGKIVEYVDLVENGNMEGEQPEDWSYFWVKEWRNSESQFEGPANIVADPRNVSNHCIKVVARSEEEALAAGNAIMNDDHLASWDTEFFIHVKQSIESGKKLRLTMRVRADKPASIHTEAQSAPTEYNYSECLGNIDFTEQWSQIVKETIVTPDMTQEENGKEMHAITFHLADFREGNVYYFDDIKLEMITLDEENIEFADENVKTICVAKWDTNKDGELSMAEAAAVTDLGEVFHENREITSFDELQYFTGLTSIGYLAFNGCTSLTSIIIPNSVTSIGQEAFSGSGGLQSINIPNGVTSIGVWAFAWCLSLDYITLPASVTSIGEAAFSNCGALTSVTVEWEEPLVVPENIFEDINYNNVTLYVPEGTNAAYKTADVWKEFFMDGDDKDEYNTKRLLRELIANMEAIGGYELDEAKTTAYGVDVTKDDIEGAITQLQQQIKDRCANAESDDLPVDATGLITNPTFTIDNGAYWEGDTPQFQAFNNAEFFETTFDFNQELTGLPNGSYLLKVKGFHRPGPYEDVFSDYQQGNDNASAQLYANDKSVTLVNMASDALEEQIDGWCGVEVSHDGTTRYVPNTMYDAYMWFNNGYYENELPVTVTDGTLTVGIRLDESVEAGWVIFDDFRLYYQGENIEFADANVKAICVANWDTNEDGELNMAEAAAVTDLGTDLDDIFNSNDEITSFDELQYFTGLTSIGENAFAGCTNLTSVTIPNSVTSIGSGAFGSTSLTSITIPNSVTSIGSGAFGSSGLTSITIPNSVTSIGDCAFSGCVNLTSVTIPSSVTSIGDEPFSSCERLTSIIVDAANPKYDSRNNCNAIIETSSITLVIGCQNTIIPNSVTSIGNGAFADCTGLISIIIPDSVTSIGDFAFTNCTGLTSITIPNNVTSIGKNAFYGCSALTSVTIPNSVTSIGWDAFYYCEGLTSVTVDWEIPLEVPTNIFIFAPLDQATLYVPTGTKAAYENAEVWKDFGEIVEMEGPNSDNKLTVAPVTVFTGSTTTMSISLENEAAMTAFELYLQLPAGVSIADADGDGYPDATLNSSRANGHSFEVRNDGNGLYHILCYSGSNRAFKGNSGELLSVTLTSDEGLENGTYQGTIHNIKFSDTDENHFFLANVEFDIEVSDVRPGDVNGDTDIDVFDVVTIVSYIMGGSPSQFHFAAADLVTDGTIDVFDLVRLVRLIMDKNFTGANSGSFDQLSGALSLRPCHDGTIALDIAGSDRYVASQFIVTLSEGQRLAGVTADGRHTISYERIADNQYAVVCYSNANETFTSNEGIMNLQVTGRGSVNIEDALFVNTNDEKVAFQNVMPGFTDGIGSLVLDPSHPTDIYSTSGALVRKAATTTQGLQSGVYIVNGKKVVR